ncbi:hypothetical protein SEMRO_1526_G279810.1 [Seminavis robusta]|uniref:Uncharacterized protein n=1 Tax=Seminavis robusta TaxID=568900 RepID=A0A9N8EQQ3_9STRA|nr:hypothetical protein SEMRO_1526_G279810.1 [Seminavis robusta]|eukprot:Sro1526_g279810.1 n/a (200) ;mRNA; r:22392-22991
MEEPSLHWNTNLGDDVDDYTPAEQEYVKLCGYLDDPYEKMLEMYSNAHEAIDAEDCDALNRGYIAVVQAKELTSDVLQRGITRYGQLVKTRLGSRLGFQLHSLPRESGPRPDHPAESPGHPADRIASLPDHQQQALGVVGAYLRYLKECCHEVETFIDGQAIQRYGTNVVDTTSLAQHMEVQLEEMGSVREDFYGDSSC